MKVPFSYLDRQFKDIDLYLNDLKEFVLTGDFTLGRELVKFEHSFSKLCNAKYAIGVASGTDALIIAMKMLGIGQNDEVITTPMTFIATVGAIVQTGAKPVFVDCEDGLVIDPDKIERAITSKTKAILPVHYTGNMADMVRIKQIADKYHLALIEYSCQALSGIIDGKPIGYFSDAACFSFHPLKNLNIWADGGMIITDRAELAEKISLFRNHGLVNRDEVAMFGINSRLDTLQAVIGNRLIREVPAITQRRIENAQKYDRSFSDLEDFIEIPVRREGVRHVFHLYVVRTKLRDQLLEHLLANGIEAKIHYPIPAHLQPPGKKLGYEKGDFPVCEKICSEIITLPAHPYLTGSEIDYVIEKMRQFYALHKHKIKSEPFGVKS